MGFFKAVTLGLLMGINAKNHYIVDQKVATEHALV